jgi:acetyl esterase/lipase
MTVRFENETMRWDGMEIPIRIYHEEGAAPVAPLVIHLHGGAFIAGGIACGQPVSELLAGAGAVVMAVAYPLAPQCRFPKPLEASYAGLSWAHKHRARWVGKKSPLFVAGEEAGGNLAASLALMARDRGAPPLAGQILLSPMLDACLATPSLRQAEAGASDCRWAAGWRDYLGSGDKACHPYASPLGSRRLAGLAPALLVTAEDDPLRDETMSYARRLREAGVPMQCHVLGGPTGWPDALRQMGNSPPWSSALLAHFVEFFGAYASSNRELGSRRTEQA